MYIPTTHPNSWIQGTIVTIEPNDEMIIELPMQTFDEATRTFPQLRVRAKVDRLFAADIQTQYYQQKIDPNPVYAVGDTVWVRSLYTVVGITPGNPPGAPPHREFGVVYWVIGRYTG